MLRLFICILLLCSCSSTSRNVEYKIYSTTNTTDTSTTCAFLFTDSVYVGVRNNEGTGACEGLDYDSGSIGHESGYKYLLKKKSSEIYDPPKDIFAALQWFIPGYFKAGSKLELYVTMPTGSWNGFQIDMMDTTADTWNVYDSAPEVIMFHLVVSKSNNNVFVKGCKFVSWKNYAFLPLTFQDGGTYKMTFIPQADTMKIYFDDSEVASFSHLTPPEMARQLLFTPYNGISFYLNNITISFAGV